jgi:hypothetical protein
MAAQAIRRHRPPGEAGYDNERGTMAAIIEVAGLTKRGRNTWA